MSHYYNDCSFKDFATRHEVLLAFNIRSIPKNLDSFIDEYHEVMKTNLSIICFTETWYKDHNIGIYNLYNYSGTHVYRTVKMGGSVSIFVKNQISFTRLDKYCFNEPCIKSVAIHI